jgi:Nuclear fragile X mental retardation-interacting protein 1 (NUFIP1)
MAIQGLATTSLPTTSLQFEHQGQLLSLNSPQDIAGWIAERKRRFPTKARIAETLAAKANEQDQPRRAQADHRRQRQQPREASQKSKEHSWSSTQTRDQKGQKQNEHAATGVKRGKRSGDYQLRRTDALSRDTSDGDAETSDDASSDGVSDDESTSSSGSSAASNSSDEAPAEQSSKVPMPAIEPAKAELSQNVKTNKVCQYMLKSGRCRKGKQCRYRHDILSDEFWSSVDSHRVEAEGPTKLSLYERLLAQQRDQEDREILHCIIHLGDRGLLAEPGS